MDANEMMNEEVMEATEEIVNSGSGKGFKVAAGVGIAVLVGGVAYKYAVKPLVAKIKAKKEQKKAEAEAKDYIDAEIVEDSEDTE